MQTCCGCHCGDTQTQFFHIEPRGVGEQAKISGGLVSLMEDGVRKFLSGDTTIEEVLTVAVAGESVAA